MTFHGTLWVSEGSVKKGKSLYSSAFSMRVERNMGKADRCTRPSKKRILKTNNYKFLETDPKN